MIRRRSKMRQVGARRGEGPGPKLVGAGRGKSCLCQTAIARLKEDDVQMVSVKACQEMPSAEIAR